MQGAGGCGIAVVQALQEFVDALGRERIVALRDAAGFARRLRGNRRFG